MRIVVTGSSGMIGSAVMSAGAEAGHDMIGLRVRANEPVQLPDCDAVIHLAGVGIGDKRWSAARKRALRESRISVTKALANAVAGKSVPPALVSMSAVGFYGDRASPCKPGDAAGDDFLAQLCAEWEAAADSARAAGARVAHPRMGVVLGHGGALKKMLLPFKLGLGGPIGNGRQHMPWIHIDDAVAALLFAAERMEGPFNLAAGSLPQREFAKALGRALRRPAFMPLPGFMIRLMFGEMGKAVLLQGQNIDAAALRAAGFDFEYEAAEAALVALMAK